jgi:PHP family Zn ribbon phosphoesterase
VKFEPPNTIGYMHLLPLSEIIVTVLGVTYPGIQKVWKIYNTLVERFGSEYAVLTDVSGEKMSEIVDPKIAEAIVRVREEEVEVIPGYDGVYGQLRVFKEQNETASRREKTKHQSLSDFM